MMLVFLLQVQRQTFMDLLDYNMCNNLYQFLTLKFGYFNFLRKFYPIFMEDMIYTFWLCQEEVLRLLPQLDEWFITFFFFFTIYLQLLYQVVIVVSLDLFYTYTHTGKKVLLNFCPPKLFFKKY